MSEPRITSGVIEQAGFLVRFQKTDLYIRDEEENEIQLDIFDALNLCACVEKAFEEATGKTFHSFRREIAEADQ
jgi:urease alpha subunit